MLDALTQRLSSVVKTLRGHARITEDNVRRCCAKCASPCSKPTSRLPVVKDFIAKVKEKALGQEVIGSLTPGQALVGVVHRELAGLDGRANAALNLRAPAARGDPAWRACRARARPPPPASSPSCLKAPEEEGAAGVCDVYRPAAIEQLATLAPQARGRFLPVRSGAEAGGHRARRAGLRAAPLLRRADRRHGRPAGIDAAMMDEIARAARGARPDRDAVRGRRDAGPGRGQRRASASARRCRSPA